MLRNVRVLTGWTVCTCAGPHWLNCDWFSRFSSIRSRFDDVSTSLMAYAVWYIDRTSHRSVPVEPVRPVGRVRSGFSNIAKYRCYNQIFIKKVHACYDWSNTIVNHNMLHDTMLTWLVFAPITVCHMAGEGVSPLTSHQSPPKITNQVVAGLGCGGGYQRPPRKNNFI